MSISSLNQFIAGQQQNLQKSEGKRGASLESLAQKAENSVFGEDKNQISSAQQEQSKAAGFRQAAAQSGKAGDVLQLASNALGAVEQKLERLQLLADKFSSGAIPQAQAQAESESIITEIETIVSSTRFADQPLLDGEFSATEEGEALGIEIANVNAAIAAINPFDVASVETAITVLSGQRQEIEGQQQDTQVVSELFEISAQNQEASRSTLPEGGELNLLEQLVSTQSSVPAQANRLQPNILSLLQA